MISDNPDIPAVHAQTLGPPSPWTPSQTPSPATSTSAIDSTDRRKCPTAPNSRAEAILAKARTPISIGHSSSGSVVEKAVRLGIKHIWSLSKTIQWLLKYKTKYGFHKLDASKEKSKSEKKQLVHPALKLEEDSPNSRPIFSELKNWPVLRFDGKPASSPYSLPSTSRQKSRNFARRVGIEPDQKEILKRSKEAEKKESKRPRKSNKKTEGFCEICNDHFSKFQKHLESQQHREFVDNSSNWSKIDSFTFDLAEYQPINLYFTETFGLEATRDGLFDKEVKQENRRSDPADRGLLRTPSQRD